MCARMCDICVHACVCLAVYTLRYFVSLYGSLAILPRNLFWNADVRVLENEALSLERNVEYSFLPRENETNRFSVHALLLGAIRVEAHPKFG